jgi:hypothetical protein
MQCKTVCPLYSQKRIWRDLLRAAVNKRQGISLSAGGAAGRTSAGCVLQPRCGPSLPSGLKPRARAEPQKQMPPVAATEAIRCSQSAIAVRPLVQARVLAALLLPFRFFRPVAFHAVVADFRRCGGPRLRHPDWFVAIRTMLPVRRHSWPRHVGDSKADNTHSIVVDVLEHCTPSELHGRTARALFLY